MPLLIRVASRPAVGGGHVSRCRALAMALSRHMPVVIVLDRDGEGWRPELEMKGLRVAIEGDEPPGPWAGSVLDGYDFGADDVGLLAERAAPVAIIDDFLDPPPGADLIINSAPGLEGSQVDGIPALLGSKYAILDSRYRHCNPKTVNERLAHVVVTFGNRDANNATCLVLEALRRAGTKADAPRISVALGGRAMHLDEVRKAVRSFGSRAELKIDEPDMLTLMQQADLVIGAGGVSLLERLACGAPSITVVTSANQRLAVQGAARLGGTVFVGSIEDLSEDSLVESIAAFASDSRRRAEIAARGPKLVDGRGGERVATSLFRLCAASRDANRDRSAGGYDEHTKP